MKYNNEPIIGITQTVPVELDLLFILNILLVVLCT